LQLFLDHLPVSRPPHVHFLSGSPQQLDPSRLLDADPADIGFQFRVNHALTHQHKVGEPDSIAGNRRHPSAFPGHAWPEVSRGPSVQSREFQDLPLELRFRDSWQLHANFSNVSINRIIRSRISSNSRTAIMSPRSRASLMALSIELSSYMSVALWMMLNHR
jgi:hypothetical protein